MFRLKLNAAMFASFSQIIGRVAACLVALFIFTAVAGAATYTVDTASDNGNLSACTAAANDCSLRGAMLKANGTPANDVITFAGSYTIIMTGRDLSVGSAATAGSLTITNSSGASNLVIDGNYLFGEFGTHLSRVFYIGAGGNLTLNGVTVRNGFSYDGSIRRLGGGGILNDGGSLLLTNSTVSENVSYDTSMSNDIVNLGGGGIFNRSGGIMTLENSTVSGNTGDNAGGGIYNEGTLSLTNSTVSGNSVPGQPSGFEVIYDQYCIGGGGICNQGTLNLTNSTVSNNSMVGSLGGGGGISNKDGVINLTNSAVVNNSAFTNPIGFFGGGGGGISNFRNGTLNLINVTVGNNSVNSSGGGISNYNGTVLLIDVTIAHNTANDSGGGVSNVGDISVGLLNTIVANNSAPAAPDFKGPVNGFSQFNLIGDGTGMTGIANGSLGNQIGSAANPIDPKLNPTLALNSGSTLNFALLTGSPAIDKGKRTVDYDVGTDQRGLPRPVDNPTTPNPAGGDGSDIGAFEVQPANAVLSDMTVTKTHGGNFTQGDTGKTYTITVSNVGTASTSGAVSVTDTLPTGLTATAISGTGWTCTLATLTCTRTNVLAANSSYPAITLTVNVAANAPSSVTNIATVSGGGETNTANNQASNPTTILTRSDLTVTKTHTGSFTQGDIGRTYSITVTNSGGTATSGTVTLVDTLPSGLTATGMIGTGWNCTLATLTCTRTDALAANGSYPTITLTVNVASNAPASVTNAVSVSGGGETNTANNTASDQTTIQTNGVFDLTITKTHTGNFTQGDVGRTYTITVSNIGTATAFGLAFVQDILPAGLTATAMTGTGWTCSVVDISCTGSGNGTLAAGASYPPITVTVNVASNAPASVINTATIAGNSEVNRANNTASDPTTINPLPRYSISGAVSYGITEAGQPTSFVSGVNLGATGTASVSAISDISGIYQLSNLPGGNYTVTPSKTGEVKGINSLDATRIQQHLVGMTTLTANQLIAADTDGSGAVNSLDATRIQQRAVGMNPQNIIGQWKFVPGSRQYNSLNGNQTGQNYQAVLVGEVSGNWATAVSFTENSLNVEDENEILPETDNQNQTAERFTDNLFGGITEDTKQSSDSLSNESSGVLGNPVIQVSLPINATRPTGSTVTIPITISAIPAGQSIESFDFSVFYNSAVLQPTASVGSSAGTLSANCSVLSFSPVAGRVIVSGACVQAITTGSGVLYNLTFNVIGAVNQTSGLSFTNPANNTNTLQFNNGTPTVTTANGQFTVLAPTAANVSISGRVLTASGRGIRNVQITLTDGSGATRTAVTTSFGYYHFDAVRAGNTYVLTAVSKRYAFGQSTQVINVNEDAVDINFTANPE